MLTYNFENRGKTSLYDYLYQCIRNDILSGKIKAGEKLPSKREMAKNHNISVITVENAYEQLMVEGYIYSEEKKGYFVGKLGAQYETVSRWSKSSESIQKNRFQKKKEKKEWLVDFNSNHIMYDSFPFATWSKIMRRTLSDREKDFLTSPSPQGIEELRIAIAEHLLHFRGMEVNPDNIIVGAGTEYLYSMIVQLLGKNTCIALEDPGYHKIGRVYESNGVQCLPIKIDMDGLCVKELEKSNAGIQKTAVAFVGGKK